VTGANSRNLAMDIEHHEIDRLARKLLVGIEGGQAWPQQSSKPL
jgi:hypothetical protein